MRDDAIRHRYLMICAFNTVLTSESPVDLAILMLKFRANLDQKMLSQLERHRKNLVSIVSIWTRGFGEKA